MKTRYIFLLISIIVFFLTPNFSCAYSAVQLTAGNNDKVTQVNNYDRNQQKYVTCLHVYSPPHL